MTRNISRITPILIAAVATVVWLAPVQAGDWPTWRGPDGTGVSSETGWDPRAVSDGSNIAWRVNVGKGHSSMVVGGTRLYTMGYDESAGGRVAEVVYCLDAATGKEIWRYAYASRHHNFPGPGATPVLEGRRLYTVGRSGEVFCFDADNGTVIWKRHLVDEGLARMPQWGFCASPAVEGNLVLLNAGRSGVAFDTRTGKTVWASEPESGWLATPVVFDQDGKRLAAIGGRGQVYVVEVATGAVQWTHRWQSDADPTLLGARMLLTGAGRAGGSALLEVNGSAPEVVWQNGSFAGAFQSVVVVGQHAYGFGRDRRDNALQCVNVTTGERAWSQDLGDWGGLIAADGKLIIIDGDGDLIIAEASPSAYKEIARTKAIALQHWRTYDEDAPRACWTSPVLANGRIYARDTWGELVCVDVGS